MVTLSNGKGEGVTGGIKKGHRYYAAGPTTEGERGKTYFQSRKSRNSGTQISIKTMKLPEVLKVERRDRSGRKSGRRKKLERCRVDSVFGRGRKTDL